MEKTLELIFTKSDGAKKTLSIADPREDVTLAEAQAAAAKIIEAGVLTSGGLALTLLCMIETIVSITSGSSITSSARVIFPLSIFDISSTSLIRLSRCFAAPVMVLIY